MLQTPVFDENGTSSEAQSETYRSTPLSSKTATYSSTEKKRVWSPFFQVAEKVSYKKTCGEMSPTTFVIEVPP